MSSKCARCSGLGTIDAREDHSSRCPCPDCNGKGTAPEEPNPIPVFDFKGPNPYVVSVEESHPVTLSAGSMASRDIIFMINGGQTILRIAPDGFYVRGVKLEQDESEARGVFDAFKDWLGHMVPPSLKI